MTSALDRLWRLWPALPSGLAFAREAASALWMTLALALVGWRLGRALARRWLPATAEAELLATALALGLVAHVVFALGLAGALGRWLPGAVSVAAGLTLPSALAASTGRRRALALAAALLLLPLALALLPPTGWDATEYHLALVKGYAQAHRVAPAWNLRYPVFPQLTEMLATVGYLGGGGLGASLTPALFVALTAAAVYRWGARYASPRAGTLAAALWLGQPMIVFLGTNLYVDAALTCYATLAVLALGSAWQDGDDRWLVAAALAAGFAASCKYLGLPVVALVLAAAPALARQRRRAAVACALAAALAGLPWYVYDFVHTHDPVFPFGGPWLGSGPWSAEDLSRQLADMRSHGVGRGLRALVLLPWSLTVAQARFLVEAPFVPVFAPALALALWGAWRDRRVRALMVVVLGYGLFWFFGMQLLRYLVPGSALFCLAVAIAAARLPLPARIARALPLVLVTPSLAYAAYQLRDGFPLSAPARAAYLGRHLPGYDAVAALNRARPEGYRAYGLHLERLIFFADGTLLGDWFGPARFGDVYARLGDPAALAAHLRRLGADSIVVPASEYPAARLRGDDYARRFAVVAALPDATVLRLR